MKKSLFFLTLMIACKLLQAQEDASRTFDGGKDTTTINGGSQEPTRISCGGGINITDAP